MAGIIYENGFVRFEAKDLEVEECIKFVESNYKGLERGMIPWEVIEVIINAYKKEKGMISDTSSVGEVW